MRPLIAFLTAVRSTSRAAAQRLCAGVRVRALAASMVVVCCGDGA